MSGPQAMSSEQQQEMQMILNNYKALRTEVSQIATKISELDGDRQEHALVLKTISGVDPSRRCYRSISGVLVERTIEEVLPAVTKNLNGIRALIEKLTVQLKTKEKEAEAFRVKHNIGGLDAKDGMGAEGQQASSAPQQQGSGVLVAE